MNEATIALTVMTGLILVIFAGFLVWGIRSGQFRDVEAAKYRMMDAPAAEDEEGGDDA